VTRRARTSTGVASIRNYRSALNFLKSKTNYETMVRVGYNSTNFNLSRMLRIVSGLGNPHKKFKSIHIAGTKGKGSTAHMIAGMLKKAGYRTGLYTSPHFVDLRERISIDERLVTEAEFTRLMARIAPVANRLQKDNPTFFELMTAAAFLHFANNKVDIAVIETGLGGRLDSTNVIRPEVCGITSISYDHTAQLGTTLEAIAEEKAGIFKPGIPVISAPQRPGVKRVLREQAKKTGCDLRFVGDDLEFSYRFESSRMTGPHTRVCMATPTARFDHVRVPLLGEHQAHNCGVALGVIDALRQRKIEVSTQDAIDGLAEVKVQGRLETIRELPHTIVDAAHNGASVRALMRAIGQNVSYDSMVVIFGCSADKDIDGMLDQLQLGADKVIFTSTGTPRSVDPHELLSRFQEKSHKMAQVEENLIDAYQTACNCVTREDLVCITGSVYLVGRAKQLLTSDNIP
jgi:dihydrofolate synthase/folylpolyglutamate synthase